jgi:histidine triad (HIT) family protein
MTKQPNPAVEALKRASKGLMMPSESDAPFTAFAWDDGAELTHDRLLQITKQPKGTTVEESTLDDLFATVPSEDKAKFQKLRQVITEQLTGVKVYKIGSEAERDLYIVGKAKDGRWTGLKTTVVET